MLVRVQPDGTTSVKVAKLKGTVLHCPPLRENEGCTAEPADQLNVNAVVLAGDVTLQMVMVCVTRGCPAPAPKGRSQHCRHRQQRCQNGQKGQRLEKRSAPRDIWISQRWTSSRIGFSIGARRMPVNRWTTARCTWTRQASRLARSVLFVAAGSTYRCALQPCPGRTFRVFLMKVLRDDAGAGGDGNRVDS